MSRTDAESKFIAELARALEDEGEYLERSRRFARWTRFLDRDAIANEHRDHR